MEPKHFQIEKKKCVAYPQEDFLLTILHGIYPTKFASSTQKHKKVIKTPNQPIEIKKITKKVCIVHVKRGKNSYGGYPTDFAGSTRNPKKNYQDTKSINQDEHFPKKSMLSTLKKKKSQKFVWG
jgi:hypothetical protein